VAIEVIKGGLGFSFETASSESIVSTVMELSLNSDRMNRLHCWETLQA
jgi:hypothetical protein